MKMANFATAFVIAAVCGCGPDARQTNDAAAPCTQGTVKCDGNGAYQCQGGTWTKLGDCATCIDGLGCGTCVPGVTSCDGANVLACNAMGEFTVSQTCAAGTTCTPEGTCEAPCSPNALGKSYLGCDYYPTIMSNTLLISAEFFFAVVVSNPNSSPVNLTITEGGNGMGPMQSTIGPGATEVIRLPWNRAFSTYHGYLAKHAYHMVSDQPIAAYQFNPLDFQSTNGAHSMTNDASLLIPTNAWGQEFFVASFQPRSDRPSQVTIVASAPDTQVMVIPSQNLHGGEPQNSPLVRTMQPGDQWQLASNEDLTSTHITADKPIEVFAGNDCVNVPFGIFACDHIEEAMLAVENLASEYVVVNAVVPSDGRKYKKPQFTRIIATHDDTDLVFNPPLPGVATHLDKAGNMIEIASHRGDFHIAANHKILVASYMQGQESDPSNIGDPAMTIATPAEQYRTAYAFLAPTNYTANYVSVIARTGTTVTLDGQPVADFHPVGTSGFSIADVQLRNNVAAHTASANSPFGISVYGYGDFTSYWYPGGLDLKDIPIE